MASRTEVLRALNYVSASTALLASQMEGGTIQRGRVTSELKLIKEQIQVVEQAERDAAFEREGG